jgi:hypothetical protein
MTEPKKRLCLGEEEQKHRQAKARKARRLVADWIRKKYGGTYEEFMERGGQAAVGLYSLLEGLDPEAAPRPLGHADLFSEEWVDLACRVYDWHEGSEDRFDENAICEVLYEMALSEDQSWRSQPLLHWFFAIMLRGFLFPPPTTSKGKQVADRYKEWCARNQLRRGNDKGIARKETIKDLINSGLFKSEYALDKFLERHTEYRDFAIPRWRPPK